MSLNQKYTWNDFLKENPGFKEKKVKRTSPEAKKAFEAAFKAKVKDVLKDRLSFIEKETVRVGKVKDGLLETMKATKKGVNKRRGQKKIGTKDKYIHRLGKMTERTKQTQKSI